MGLTKKEISEMPVEAALAELERIQEKLHSDLRSETREKNIAEKRRSLDDAPAADRPVLMNSYKGMVSKLLEEYAKRLERYEEKGEEHVNALIKRLGSLPKNKGEEFRKLVQKCNAIRNRGGILEETFEKTLEECERLAAGSQGSTAVAAAAQQQQQPPVRAGFLKGAELDEFISKCKDGAARFQSQPYYDEYVTCLRKLVIDAQNPALTYGCDTTRIRELRDLMSANQSCTVCSGIDVYANTEYCLQHYFDSVFYPRISKTRFTDVNDFDAETCEKLLNHPRLIHDGKMTLTRELMDDMVQLLKGIDPEMIEPTAVVTSKAPPPPPPPKKKASPSLSSSSSSCSSSSSSEEEDEEEEEEEEEELSSEVQENKRKRTWEEVAVEQVVSRFESSIPAEPLKFLKMISGGSRNAFDQAFGNTLEEQHNFYVVVCTIDGSAYCNSSHPTWDAAQAALPKDTEHVKYSIIKV